MLSFVHVNGKIEKTHNSPIPFYDASIIGKIEKDNLRILSFFSQQPGKRYGCQLLLHIVQMAFQQHVKFVTLDDASGILPPKNIYFRLGFKVRNKTTRRFISWKRWLSLYPNEHPDEERKISIYMLRKNLLSFLQ